MVMKILRIIFLICLISLCVACGKTYEDGLADGYTEGYDQGFDDGFCEASDYGYYDGYADGYADAENEYWDGYIDVNEYGAERYEEGYVDGYYIGYLDGGAERQYNQDSYRQFVLVPIGEYQYHYDRIFDKEQCSYISDKETELILIEEAIKRGCTPCPYCMDK